MSVLGTYTATANTPIGEKTMEISIFKSESGHTGLLRSEETKSAYELSDVKVNGNNFTFDINLKLPLPLGTVLSTFNCNVNGGTLTGEVVTPYATVDLRGKKV